MHLAMGVVIPFRTAVSSIHSPRLPTTVVYVPTSVQWLPGNIFDLAHSTRIYHAWESKSAF